MSIPYNDNLKLTIYQSNPRWHETMQIPSEQNVNQIKRAAKELFGNTFKEPVVRSIQFLRDSARLVFKVPVRALIIQPIFLKKNWQELERTKVNAKLCGYSFVQVLSVIPKFIVTIIALATSLFSAQKAKWLLDKSEACTSYLDGRASQLEALKEEGAKPAKDRLEFEAYRTWLYTIDPKLCRKTD